MESVLKNKLKKIVSVEEPDFDFLDYSYGLEKAWQKSLYDTLPKTDMGWIEIFPEARVTIPDKIKDWENIAKVAQEQIKKELVIMEEKSTEQNREFLRAVIKYTSPAVREFAIARRRISNLKFLLPNKSNGSRRKWETSLTKAKERDLIEITEHYGMKLRKTGNTYQTLCPFHSEKTPSFHIYPPFRFICFGCNVKGDTIEFIKLMHKCDFKDAVYKLQTI